MNTIIRVSRSSFIISLFVVSLILFASFSVLALQPSGGTPTVTSTSTAPADSAGNNSAIAGNVTEMNIFGRSTTQSWQGYYGNVTGTIQLADSSNNVLYNWSLAEPSGEVYASTNNSFTWLNVQCFNYSAAGNLSNNMTGETAGSVNLFGMNLSQLEFQYNLTDADVDGVNETFTLQGAGTHDTFFTANLLFSEGECRSTRVFDSTGIGVSNHYEEAILYESVSDSVIFTSILEKGALNGFNGNDHDFEMLVLENGHGTDTSATTYYFWVELE